MNERHGVTTLFVDIRGEDASRRDAIAAAAAGGTGFNKGHGAQQKPARCLTPKLLFCKTILVLLKKELGFGAAAPLPQSEALSCQVPCIRGLPS